MATEQNNQEPLKDKGSSTNENQSQNNSGNFAREPGIDDKENPEFSSDGRKDPAEKPVNESGIAENQENHWSGNYGHKSSTNPGSKNTDPYSDQNLSDGIQNQGKNHVTNAGGTSQEDLEKGNTGLRDNEDKA